MQHEVRLATTHVRFADLGESPQHKPRQVASVEELLEELDWVGSQGDVGEGRMVLTTLMESDRYCDCLPWPAGKEESLTKEQW